MAWYCSDNIPGVPTLERDGCMGEPGPGSRRWMEKGLEVEYWGQGNGQGRRQRHLVVLFCHQYLLTPFSKIEAERRCYSMIKL